MRKANQSLTTPLSFEDVMGNVFGEIENSISPKVITLDDIYIRPKEGERLIKLVPNRMQRKFIDYLGIDPYQKFAMRGRREIMLKARQLGFTTIVSLLFLLDTLTHPYTYSVIVAHDADTTAMVFDIVRRAYENLPPDKKPETKYNSKTELSFPALDSKIYVGTAGSRSFGRATTVNNALLTEVASYDDAESLISGLLQAVPSTGNVILESTAEGMGTYYHQEYEKALNNDSIFTPHFSAWFLDDKYQIPVPSDFQLTEEEEKFGKTYSLSLEQINWYRHKKKELRHLVTQEYPSTPEEAFLSAGGDFFDSGILMEYILGAKLIQTVDKPDRSVLPVTYSYALNQKRGTLNIYKYPVPGHRYIITGDTSEGEEQKDTDFSAGDVIDVETWEQVAHIHGKFEPDKFAHLLMEIGHWYNHGLLVIERNNHGHTTLNEIKNHSTYGLMNSTKWGGLYMHKEYDAKNRQFTYKPGFPTNVKNKPMMLDALDEQTKERAIIINHTPSLVEMKNYKILKNGKYGAPKGLHDDRVISLALGAYILKNPPKFDREVKKSTIKRGRYV